MSLLIELSKTERLQTLVMIQNEFGSFTYRAIADYLIPSNMFKSVKKFVIRDPNPGKFHQKEMFKISQ